jgi:Na+/melibiose symporter-like transporter
VAHGSAGALAFMSTNLLFLAPVLVTLALKVDSLVGIERAPASLALVAGIGALVSMVGNPFFGRMSDRTASPLGMRRPWMAAGLAILAIGRGGGSYSVLYMVAGLCAIIGAFAILPVRRVR